MVCDYADPVDFPGVTEGRRCKLNGCLCHNYGRSDYKEKCPIYCDSARSFKRKVDPGSVSPYLSAKGV